MAKEIIMPKLSDTMEEGTFISWKKSVGDKVNRGDIVAEIETDKANMELEAFDTGILLETNVEAGEVVPVGTVIGLIGEPGEKPGSKPGGEKGKERADAEKKSAEEKMPEERKIVAEPGEQPEEKAPVGGERKTSAEPTKEESAAEEEKTGESVEKKIEAAAVEEKASPMVRRIAREEGIDLGNIRGTGPDGRILREDLENYLKEQGKEEGKTSAVAIETSAGRKRTEPLSRMRAAIAKNVAASWRTIPHFSVSNSVDMGEAERMLRGIREAGVSISINDIIVKAVAMALRKYPRLNASLSEDGVNLYSEINIGIAVSVEDGLLVPVVRGCDGLELKALAARSRDLIGRAREGKISERDIGGGTFTVSNLGMFGIDDFFAVIYPGQAAILAVAAVKDTAVVSGERLIAARIMKVTLSADHRLVDGADAARFLSELKNILENPFSMLV